MQCNAVPDRRCYPCPCCRPPCCCFAGSRSSARKQVATEGSSMSPLTIRRRSSGSPTRHTCKKAGGWAGGHHRASHTCGEQGAGPHSTQVTGCEQCGAMPPAGGQAGWQAAGQAAQGGGQAPLYTPPGLASPAAHRAAGRCRGKSGTDSCSGSGAKRAQSGGRQPVSSQAPTGTCTATRSSTRSSSWHGDRHPSHLHHLTSAMPGCSSGTSGSQAPPSRCASSDSSARAQACQLSCLRGSKPPVGRHHTSWFRPCDRGGAGRGRI